MPKLDIYGLTNDEINQLKRIAYQKIGKDSVSLLAKTCLLALLEPFKISSASNNIEEQSDSNKYRLELRLIPTIYYYLKTAASQQFMTPNAVAVSILRHYIDQHPTLSDKEAEALYQSNYQLLRIGRNLNQIARQLNVGESISLTAHEIRQLRKIIEQHTDKVSDVLQANKQRYSEK